MPKVTKKQTALRTEKVQDKITDDLNALRFAEALTRAKANHDKLRTPTSRELLENIANQCLQVEFATRVQHLQALTALIQCDFRTQAWLERVAVFQAQLGLSELPRALARVQSHNGANLDAQLLAHALDWQLRHRKREGLPPEHQQGYDAVLKAFELYHTKQDEAARAELRAVSLTSPWLDWKLLLRGLMAWSNRDDAKVVENFTRLTKNRLPYRLALGVWKSVDAKIAATFSDSRSALANRSLAKLRQSTLLNRLRVLQKDMSKQRELAPAFKAAEAIVVELRTLAPKAIPRLANFFYFAILRQGVEKDVDRHRKLFGVPADDPQYQKLAAMVFEQLNQPESSLFVWQEYENWLRKAVGNWPSQLTDRTRAIVLHHMGNLAKLVAEQHAEDAMASFRPKKLSKAKPPPVISAGTFWKQAQTLAPDWELPARSLFDSAMDRGETAEAIAIAEAHLQQQPDSLYFTNKLVTLNLAAGSIPKALLLAQRAMVLNPLDEIQHIVLCQVQMASVRHYAMNGDMKAAKALAAEVLVAIPTNSTDLVAMLALCATIERKLGDHAAAAEFEKQSLATPHQRIAYAFHTLVNSSLLKLKPADKKAATTAYAKALEQAPTPEEVRSLHWHWCRYGKEGLTYTGQKTQEKKLLDVMMTAVLGEGTLEVIEAIAWEFLKKGQYDVLKKLGTKLMHRHPDNPVFYVLAAESELGKSLSIAYFRIDDYLRKAKRLAEASTLERHKALLPRIEELLQEANPFGSMFDRFFRG